MYNTLCTTCIIWDIMMLVTITPQSERYGYAHN